MTRQTLSELMGKRRVAQRRVGGRSENFEIAATQHRAAVCGPGRHRLPVDPIGLRGERRQPKAAALQRGGGRFDRRHKVRDVRVGNTAPGSGTCPGMSPSNDIEAGGSSKQKISARRRVFRAAVSAPGAGGSASAAASAPTWCRAGGRVPRARSRDNGRRRRGRTRSARRRRLVTPPTCAGHQRLAEAAVEGVDEQPGAAIGHAHLPPRGRDRPRRIDQLQELDLAGADLRDRASKSMRSVSLGMASRLVGPAAAIQQNRSRALLSPV